MDEYLALPDGAGSFPQDFSGPVVLRDPTEVSCLTHTGLSPSLALLSSQLLLRRVTSRCGPYNPAVAETTTVWALSRSLAATKEITIVFSSSGY